MKIAIVSIGNEILNGSIVDTNSNHIAKTLMMHGYEADRIYAIKDDKNELSKALKCLSVEYDLIITTGGLGPTFDDVTMESVADSVEKPLKLNKKAYFDVVRKVKSKGVKLKLSHLRQVYLPDGCTVLKNEYGTAPGIVVKAEKAYIISLPGVPSEMKPMFENYAMPAILDIFPKQKKIRYDLKLIGVAESDMDEFLSEIDTSNIDIILNAQEGELAVRLFSYDKDAVENIVKAVEDNFALKLYSKNDEKIENVVDRLLSEKGLKLGIIESFTGGYLTLLMSDKKSFVGSVVKNSDNAEGFNNIKNADLIVYPNSLNGNNFILNLYFKGELNQIYTRYMGNVNFMKKSVAKRTLGHVYEFIKSMKI